MSGAATRNSPPRSEFVLNDLAAEGITVGYGRVTVLREVSFSVQHGECIGLLGPNGAGKTTLLSSLAGLLIPTGGRIVSGDHEITTMPAEERRQRGLSLLQEGRRIFPRLTVQETLVLAHETLGLKRSAIAGELAEIYDRFPNLGTRKNVAAGLLSGGEQQMLCLARAMACGPSILLIDEPFMGLAPLVISFLTDYLRELRTGGVTMVIAEESRSSLERLGADRLIEMHALDEDAPTATTAMEVLGDQSDAE